MGGGECVAADYFDLLKVLGVAGVTIAILVFVIATIGTALPANSTAQNITNGIVTAYSQITTWYPILFVVLFAGMALAFINMGIGGFGRGGSTQ